MVRTLGKGAHFFKKNKIKHHEKPKTNSQKN